MFECEAHNHTHTHIEYTSCTFSINQVISFEVDCKQPMELLLNFRLQTENQLLSIQKSNRKAGKLRYRRKLGAKKEECNSISF